MAANVIHALRITLPITLELDAERAFLVCPFAAEFLAAPRIHKATTARPWRRDIFMAPKKLAISLVATQYTSERPSRGVPIVGGTEHRTQFSQVSIMAVRLSPR